MTKAKKFLLKVACLTFLAIFSFATPLLASTSEAELRKLLQENPEIIIDFLYENSEELVDIVQHGVDTRRDAQLMLQWEQESTIKRTFTTNKRPVLGSPDAPIHIFGFTDFTCSYCQVAAHTIATLVEKYPNEVNFTFKAKPNSDIGRYASRFFIAAYSHDKEKAWLLHDAIFENQQAYISNPIVTITNLANSVGFDATALEKYAYENLSTIDAIISADLSDAQEANVAGTPHFFVQSNNMEGALSLPGALPLSTFEKAVDFARNK